MRWVSAHSDKQRGAEERHDREQVERGQRHVDVGGQRPDESPTVRRDELVPVVPIGHGPHDRQRRQQPRDVQLHRVLQHRILRQPRSRLRLRRRSNAPVQIMGDQRQEQREHKRGEHPVDEERPERQPEDVVPGVVTEQRILPPEVAAVDEQHPGRPSAGRVQPGNQGEKPGHRQPKLGRVRSDRFVVPHDHVVWYHALPERWSEAFGDVEIPPQQDEEHGSEHHDHHDLGDHDLVPDRRETELGEPQTVGVDAGEAIG